MSENNVWQKIEEQKQKDSEEAHRILDGIRKKNPKISLDELQKEYDKARGIKRYEDIEIAPSFTTKQLSKMNLRELTDLFHYDKVGYDWLNENREANWSYSQFAEQFYGAFVYDKDWQKNKAIRFVRAYSLYVMGVRVLKRFFLFFKDQRIEQDRRNALCNYICEYYRKLVFEK